MPSTADLTTHATSPHDFYALLSLPSQPPPTQRDLDRAWRKTALKHHPDKQKQSSTSSPQNTPSSSSSSKSAQLQASLEKFHLAQIAYDVLSDPAVKALYDNARSAREQKKQRHEAFEGERRRMKEDLEMREKGTGGKKRGRGQDDGGGGNGVEDEETVLRRLAADGKRRRKEREEALKKIVVEEEERAQQQSPSGNKGADSPSLAAATAAKKFRFSTDGAGFLSNPTTPQAKERVSDIHLKKKSSFYNPSAGTVTPKGSPGMSFLESTMARLREAENRRVSALKND